MTESDVDTMFFRGFIAAGVIAAYTMAPLVRLAPPSQLALAGGFMAAGASICLSSLGRGEKTLTYVGAVIGSIGLAYLAYLQIGASQAADIIDQRCALLQTEMLSASKDRAAAAQVFQALGCRPQGI